MPFLSNLTANNLMIQFENFFGSSHNSNKESTDLYKLLNFLNYFLSNLIQPSLTDHIVLCNSFRTCYSIRR